MTQNQVEGGVREMGGRLQDAAGGLAGDNATQMRGKINEAAGHAQQVYGDAVDEVREFATAQPITALLTAMGVGVVLGFVLGRR